MLLSAFKSNTNKLVFQCLVGNLRVVILVMTVMQWQNRGDVVLIVLLNGVVTVWAYKRKMLSKNCLSYLIHKYKTYGYARRLIE